MIVNDDYVDEDDDGDVEYDDEMFLFFMFFFNVFIVKIYKNYV